MAKRIIAIGGEPASGKTTMMRKIIKHFQPLRQFKFGLVRGLYSEKKKLYFIGIYDNSTFSGTDKLSMAVQPDFLKLIEELHDGVIVFEGDRLFNQSLFDQKACEIYIVETTEQMLEQRHKKRSDNQTDKFKKAKKTKIQNIRKNNEHATLKNITEADLDECVEFIIKRINHGLQH